MFDILHENFKTKSATNHQPAPVFGLADEPPSSPVHISGWPGFSFHRKSSNHVEPLLSGYKTSRPGNGSRVLQEGNDISNLQCMSGHRAPHCI